MKGSTRTQAAWLVAGALVAGCSSDSPTQPPIAKQVQLVDDLGASWSAVIEDPVTLARARALAGSSRVHWFYGTIRRGNGGHNEPWGWHLDPATVDFAEVTVEVCQTPAAYIDRDLDYWLDYGTVCILSHVRD